MLNSNQKMILILVAFITVLGIVVSDITLVTKIMIYQNKVEEQATLITEQKKELEKNREELEQKDSVLKPVFYHYCVDTDEVSAICGAKGWGDIPSEYRQESVDN